MAQIVIPFGPIVDDLGAIVASPTVTLVSVKAPVTDANIAADGATVSVSADGLRGTVLYDPAVKGQAFITLLVSKVGSPITGSNANIVLFASIDPQTIADRSSQASLDAEKVVVDATKVVVDAITLKTVNLPLDPASNTQVANRASQASLDTLAGYVDTEVAAIKAQTDLLPSDPADASVVAAAFAATNALIEAISSIAVLRYGVMLCTYSEAQSVIQEFSVNVGEDTWIESKVVDEDGNPIPLDAYTLTATLTGSGGFSQALDNTKVNKINDGGGLNIDGRFRWQAHGMLTSVARRNVRFTLLLSGGAGNVRTALARVQVEA